MTQDKTGTSQKRVRRGFSPLFLVFLGIVSAVIGSMSARGNGLPPILYFFSGAVFLPLVADLIGKRLYAARRVQLIVMALGAVACFAAAYISSRQSPDVIFEHVFRAPPPASVTGLRARKQWFDGQLWLVECNMSDADFESLLATSNAEVDEDQATSGDDSRWNESKWRIAIGVWGSIAYDFLPRDPPANTFTFYNWRAAGAENADGLQIARDPASQRVWAVRLD